jgi:hypothetical protein
LLEPGSPFVISQFYVCLSQRIGELVQCCRESPKTWTDGRQMILLELSAAIIEPALSNTRPQFGEL